MNRRRSIFNSVPPGLPVTVGAVRARAQPPVAIDAVLHAETADALRRRRRLRDRTVAGDAFELRDHDVAPVRIEDVGRLTKERLPLERRAGLDQSDELRLFLALALRLRVAPRADVGARQPRERLLFVGDVTRQTRE